MTRPAALDSPSWFRSVVALPFVLTLLTPADRAAAQTVRGIVIDVRTSAPVVGAMVRLGVTEHYGISREDGRFTVDVGDATGTHMLVATAPGYAKRYEPAEVGGEAVTIRMDPEPIELEGVEASVTTYRTHMRRRLNALSAAGTFFYTLEGGLLTESTADNVWELVGRRHGFYFEGYSDYGCPLASIHGERGRVNLFIDDRPVRFGIFEEHAPQDFVVVEVIAFGRQINAYTQKYLDWMTGLERRATPFEMLPGLCPPLKTPPGTMKRGRPVGPS